MHGRLGAFSLRNPLTVLRRLLAGEPARDPLDERWYRDEASAETAAGPLVTPDRALAFSAVYACVRFIAGSISILPLNVYQRTGNKRRVQDEHPVQWLLHYEPHPDQTPHSFRELTAAAIEMRGNAFWWKTRDALGRVKALRYLHPDLVRIKVEGGRKVFEVREDAGGWRRATSEQVLHIPNFGTDGAGGLSTLACAREGVGLGVAAEQFGASFFRNDARPSVYIQSPNKISDEDKARYRENWQQAQTGANRFKIAIMDQGKDLRPIQISPVDAQYIETRTFQAEEICRFFGVPPFFIGLLSKSTSWGSGLGEQKLGYLTFSLLPRLKRIEDWLDKSLLTPEERRAGHYTKFNIRAFLAGDQKSQAEFLSKGREWGWYSANDCREWLEEDPIAGGDDYIRPMNMQPIGAPESAGNSNDNSNGNGADEAVGEGDGFAAAMRTLNGALNGHANGSLNGRGAHHA